MYVFTDTAFEERMRLPPNMGITLLPNSRYACGVDLSQMHIPFRSYSKVSSP